MNKKDGKYVFTPMEFWLLIFLLLFVAIFVGYASFKNAGNGSALNYVSFAATLISIILALVAIGYTYGESVAERSKSDRLELEISKLTHVSDTLNHQSESIGRINEVADKLKLLEPSIISAGVTKDLLEELVRADTLMKSMPKSDKSEDVDSNADKDFVCRYFSYVNSKCADFIKYIYLFALDNIVSADDKPVGITNLYRIVSVDMLDKYEFLNKKAIYDNIIGMTCIEFVALLRFSAIVIENSDGYVVDYYYLNNLLDLISECSGDDTWKGFDDFKSIKDQVRQKISKFL